MAQFYLHKVIHAIPTTEWVDKQEKVFFTKKQRKSVRMFTLLTNPGCGMLLRKLWARGQ